MTSVDRCFVSLVQDRDVKVRCRDRKLRRTLRDLGGRRTLFTNSWWISYSTEKELCIVLGKLRDVGIPFVGGPAGWPPAEVFCLLRDKGLLNGKFQEIVWRGPGQPVITTR